MSQRRSARSNANAEEQQSDPSLDGAIKECVRYILCREGSKVPIKRSEIAKHLASVCNTPPKFIKTCCIEANKILKKVYGYKMVQVQVKSNDVQFIIVLEEECESMPSTAADPDHRKILIAALMHIYMTGTPVSEEEMWSFLSECGLLEENNHASRKLLTITFTKQMYLQHYKVGEGDLARWVFAWGIRATEEIPKLFMLNKMAQAFGKQPEHWQKQFKEATDGDTET